MADCGQRKFQSWSAVMSRLLCQGYPSCPPGTGSKLDRASVVEYDKCLSTAVGLDKWSPVRPGQKSFSQWKVDKQGDDNKDNVPLFAG